MTNKTITYKKQKGFTLVELAIVLVIIGLIVSSVLVGQDLIKAAQLRATVRQFQEFQVGTNTFIVKYNAVPGDMLAATAVTFFGAVGAGGGAGADGDGVIEGVPATGTIVTYRGEIQNFWTELTMPGKELISGSYNGYFASTACTVCSAGVDFPAMKFSSGGWGVYGNSTSGVNYLFAGADTSAGAAATTMMNPFIPVDAYTIDSKIDDGLPSSGDVRAGGGATLATFVTTLVPQASCVASSAYVLTTTTAACALQFELKTF